jgi:hypothetical protein
MHIRKKYGQKSQAWFAPWAKNGLYKGSAIFLVALLYSWDLPEGIKAALYVIVPLLLVLYAFFCPPRRWMGRPHNS